jgi:hypothetical protein
MADTSYPVTVAVERPDGSVEHVRVGTAVRQGAGFSIRLGELTIGAASAEPAFSPPRGARPAPPPPAAAGGMVFPPYGRSKGAPIVGASVGDLEYYASGARRSLADPSKSRWHDKERQLLAAIEAELARQQGGGGPPPGRDDDYGPPRGDHDAPPMDEEPF